MKLFLKICLMGHGIYLLIAGYFIYDDPIRNLQDVCCATLQIYAFIFTLLHISLIL